MYYYFLGIGGIGMSALARYFNSNGVIVSGYDKTCTPLTRQLENEGMQIHYEDNTDVIPDNIDMVIYTPAIPATNNNYQYLKNKGILFKKRSEVLGMLTRDKYTIAIAGTHGKTSITSLIAHIIKSSGLNLNAFIGGISKNYNTNVLISDNSGKSEIWVVEADEFDKSFLTLNPDIAVITAMDADHLDIYKSKENLESHFIKFAKQVKSNGTLFINSSLITKFLVPDSQFPVRPTPYSLKINSQNIKVDNNKYVFDIAYKDKVINDIHYSLPGKHNIENAIIATIVALEMGLDAGGIKNALESYNGVVRRFDYRIKTNDLVYIDDYAHHPEELKACILAVKELYKGKKITGIFQPHLYSRTRDFADEFAKALEMLDELILLDIYPARELPIEGITSMTIFNKVNLKNKTLCNKDEVLTILKNNKIEVLLTLGAGDIDTLVEPITNFMLTKFNIQNYKS